MTKKTAIPEKSEVDQARREFLSKAGKVAVTAPAVAVLLSIGSVQAGQVVARSGLGPIAD